MKKLALILSDIEIEKKEDINYALSKINSSINKLRKKEKISVDNPIAILINGDLISKKIPYISYANKFYSDLNKYCSKENIETAVVSGNHDENIFKLKYKFSKLDSIYLIDSSYITLPKTSIVISGWGDAPLHKNFRELSNKNYYKLISQKNIEVGNITFKNYYKNIIKNVENLIFSKNSEIDVLSFHNCINNEGFSNHYFLNLIEKIIKKKKTRNALLISCGHFHEGNTFYKYFKKVRINYVNPGKYNFNTAYSFDKNRVINI